MEIKDQALIIAEEAAKALVEASYDKIIDTVCEEIKKSIPGTIDDMIIEAIKPMVAPKLKEILLEEISKISTVEK